MAKDITLQGNSYGPDQARLLQDLANGGPQALASNQLMGVAQAPITITAATFTPTDVTKAYRMNSGAGQTVTVNALGVGLSFNQVGAGATTFTAGAGVTFTHPTTGAVVTSIVSSGRGLKQFLLTDTPGLYDAVGAFV
jgi:hypothetical protein